jgi:hypothetical protein
MALIFLHDVKVGRSELPFELKIVIGFQSVKVLRKTILQSTALITGFQV